MEPADTTEFVAASAVDPTGDCPDSDRDMATCPDCDICPYSGFENGG